MKPLFLSKLLDIVSYIGLIGLMIFFFWGNSSTETSLSILLLICIARMIAANIKSRHFIKESMRLKEENEFCQRRIKELESEQKTSEDLSQNIKA